MKNNCLKAALIAVLMILVLPGASFADAQYLIEEGAPSNVAAPVENSLDATTPGGISLDATTPGAIYTAEVSNLKIEAGDGKLTLKWTDPDDINLDKTVITGSAIEITEIAKGVQQATFTNLKNDTEYTFTVRVKDSLGNLSNGCIITGTPRRKEDVDQDGSINIVDAAKIVLNFNAKSGDSGWEMSKIYDFTGPGGIADGVVDKWDFAYICSKIIE